MAMDKKPKPKNRTEIQNQKTEKGTETGTGGIAAIVNETDHEIEKDDRDQEIVIEEVEEEEAETEIMTMTMVHELQDIVLNMIVVVVVDMAVKVVDGSHQCIGTYHLQDLNTLRLCNIRQCKQPVKFRPRLFRKHHRLLFRL